MSDNANSANVSIQADKSRALTWTEMDTNFGELKKTIDDTATKVDQTDYDTKMTTIDSRLDSQKYRQVPVVEQASGDGLTTAFTLKQTISDPVDGLFVYLNGTYVDNSDGTTYTVSGSTITFATAPISGVNNLDFVVLEYFTYGNWQNLIPINTSTLTAYTLRLVDVNALLMINSPSSNTLTIPTDANVAIPVGATVKLYQKGAGVITVAGDTGVTVSSPGTLTSDGVNTILTLIKIGTNEWSVQH